LPLAIDDVLTLTLRVEFWCRWDDREHFVTFEESKFHLGVQGKPDPLFRFEHSQDLDRDTPVAHLQVHAHRDETSFLMTRAERKRPRNRRKTDRMGLLSELHFPLGGHRFRPCLEDVLHMVILEFGVKTSDTWRHEITGATPNLGQLHMTLSRQWPRSWKISATR
jgi:hypothetical protein